MSERFQRALPWITGILVVAGVVAVLTVRAGGDDKGEEARPAAQAPPAVVDTQPTQPTGRPTKVARAARVAAGEFILAAAGRENLKKAWELTPKPMRLLVQGVADREHPRPVLPGRESRCGGLLHRGGVAEPRRTARRAGAEGGREGEGADILHRAQDEDSRRQEALARQLLGAVLR
jgi:hypothetical protein